MTAADDYTIQGLSVGLRALEIIIERERTTVSALAQDLEVGRSRAHRILRTLEAEGYVITAEHGPGYVLGPRMLLLTVSAGLDLRYRFAHRDLLSAAVEASGESVHIGVLSGDQLLVTDGRQGSILPTIGLRTGMMMPAHAMAGGQLLLAQFDNAQLRALFPTRLLQVSENTLLTLEELTVRLKQVRALGHAITLQESERGVDSVAVLIPSRRRRDRRTLVLSAPAARGGMKRMTQLAAVLKLLCETAQTEMPKPL